MESHLIKACISPENIEPLPANFFEKIENLSNHEIAFNAIHQFVSEELPNEELKKIIAGRARLRFSGS